jgi:hypothetical protein
MKTSCGKLDSERRNQSRTASGEARASFAFHGRASARRASSSAAELGGLGRADTRKACEIPWDSRQPGGQVAIEACQQFAGEVDSALAAHADTQEDRQQFRVGQGGGALLASRSRGRSASGQSRMAMV